MVISAYFTNDFLPNLELSAITITSSAIFTIFSSKCEIFKSEVKNPSSSSTPSHPTKSLSAWKSARFFSVRGPIRSGISLLKKPPNIKTSIFELNKVLATAREVVATVITIPDLTSSLARYNVVVPVSKITFSPGSIKPAA